MAATATAERVKPGTKSHPRGLTIKVREGEPAVIGGRVVTVNRHRGNQFLVNVAIAEPSQDGAESPD